MESLKTEIDIQLVQQIAKEMEIELLSVVKKHYERLPYKKYEVWFSLSDLALKPVVTIMLAHDCIVNSPTLPSSV